MLPRQIALASGERLIPRDPYDLSGFGSTPSRALSRDRLAEGEVLRDEPAPSTWGIVGCPYPVIANGGESVGVHAHRHGVTGRFGQRSEQSLRAGVRARSGAYFCDLDNQRIRRLDLKTHRTTAVAGNGQRAYGGDGGAATAALNMPHEVQFDSAGNMYIVERDNHVVRKVEANTGITSTFAGTGMPGFSEDGGPAARFASLTALPSIPAASCSSATSGTTAFDRSIFPPA